MYLGPLMDTLDRNLGLRVLKALPILKDLSESERTRMVGEFKEQEYSEGEFIVRQGDRGDTFYIIRDGQAEVSKNVEGIDEVAVITLLGSGDYFGEGALLKDEPRAANVRAVNGVVKVFLARAVRV